MKYSPSKQNIMGVIEEKIKREEEEKQRQKAIDKYREKKKKNQFYDNLSKNVFGKKYSKIVKRGTIDYLTIDDAKYETLRENRNKLL